MDINPISEQSITSNNPGSPIQDFFGRFYNRQTTTASATRTNPASPVLPSQQPLRKAVEANPEKTILRSVPLQINAQERTNPNQLNFKLDNPAQWTYGRTMKTLNDGLYIAVMNRSDQEKTEIKNRKLTIEEWSCIFEKINKECINKPYAGDRHHVFESNVWRPNHNGTHSARQAHLFEVLHKLIKTESSQPYNFSNEELNSLQLAAYCYRAGRVDETGGGKDQNRLRSAQVYEAHARQMGFSDQVVK